MARISELHYSNAYAASSGISEFLEVALGVNDDPADFTVSFYQADGTVGLELPLDHPDVQVSLDPDNGEMVYVISADYFNIALTDPDGGGAGNYEAFALTDTASGYVVDFYDIGGGTQQITAQDGAAAGATSENLTVLVGPNSTTTTLQFNQPDPDVLTHDTIGAGDTGIACFVKGALIDTPDGPRAIETLAVGDQVLTQDNGVAVLRWIGSRTVRAKGEFAPVRIAKGTLGALRDHYVSPQHRMLVTGWQAELLFGESEILVPAKALVNDQTVRISPRHEVTYFHLLFDEHEIVTADGVQSESFYPSEMGMNGIAQQTYDEVISLFPELVPLGAGYGATARLVGTVREAGLLAVS